MLETVVEKEKGSEGFLLVVGTESLDRAQRICKTLIEGVQVTEGGALLLEASPGWAKAINAVLIKRGVRVSELCPIASRAGEEGPMAPA